MARSIVLGSGIFGYRRIRFRTHVGKGGLGCAVRIFRTPLFVVLVLLGAPETAASQMSADDDKVFRSADHEVTFRYPAGWVRKEPQLRTTVVLLYATDGSNATCNMKALAIPKLHGLDEQKLDILRKANHSRKYFEETLGNALPGFSIIRYWRGQLGQKESGAIEFRHELLINDTRINVHAFIISTFANGRRFTLTCNAPLGKAEAAKRAFDYIRTTTLFMY